MTDRASNDFSDDEIIKRIEDAAKWLADQSEAQPQVIHLLQAQFSITAVQAAQACTLANKYRMVRRAMG
jgi:hypothetical protein